MAGGVEWIPNNDFDVVIIGAGISGINTAHRIHNELPNHTYAILEVRDSLGGTWDLFRYPGIRSDSDLFTFGFSWYPWTSPNPIAEGSAIKQYMKDAAARYGTDQNILYKHKVNSVHWSGATKSWSLDVRHGDQPKIFMAHFFIFGTGYYDYHKALATDITGLDSFRGTIVHPQFWPEDLNYNNKNVVVIGSGATAITLVPKLAESAAKHEFEEELVVTDTSNNDISQVYPHPEDHPVSDILRFVSHISWDCEAEASPRNYTAASEINRSLHTGRVDIKTDTINQCTESGVQLNSGETLHTDIIIAATGLKVQFGGGIPITVDDKQYHLHENFMWKGMMMEDLPNAALVIRYTNISWTLGADVAGILVCRLLKHLERKRCSALIPRVPAGIQLRRRKMLNLSSTYISKAENDLPRTANTGPWQPKSNYLWDLITAKCGKLEESLELIYEEPPSENLKDK